MVGEQDFKKLDDKTAKIAIYHPHLHSIRAIEMLLDNVTFLESVNSSLQRWPKHDQHNAARMNASKRSFQNRTSEERKEMKRGIDWCTLTWR